MSWIRRLRSGLVLWVLCLTLTGPAQATVDQAPARPGPDWTAPRAIGQMLVKLSDLNAETLDAQVADAGGAVLRTIPAVGLAVVQMPPDADLRAASADLEALAEVEWVEPNYTLALDFIPNDPYYSTQSGYLNRMGLSAAWDLTTGEPGIVLAVLDTGVDMNHADLQGAIWVNPGETPLNGVDDDGNGFIDDVHGWDFAGNDNLPDDDYGHGTHVAGIAAARINNGIGIAGVAGNATIMPVDVFGGGIGTYEDLIRAIIYATDNGARVINMSLGASSYSRGEEMAVNYAVEHGVVVVAAAGNTGRESYHYPAAHASVIAVAATTSGDYLASFSTRGDFVDVAAPGVSIYSTLRNNTYGAMSGTSMATPHVSGLAALILSRNPGLTPTQVRQLIESTATDLGPTGRDIYFGYGRVDAALALASTPPGSAPPTPTPGPPLEIWPDGCQELIPDGGFEDGLGGWQVSGAAGIDATQVYTGSYAAHFLGGPNASGVLSRTLQLPANASEGALWFAYRISSQDYGWGTTPTWPFDDWLVAEWRTADGQAIQELLRTGNTADSSNDGLPWDRYLYRLQPADMQALRMAGAITLVFRSQSDQDTAATDFWVDGVRFCVAGSDDVSPTPTATPAETETPTVTPTATATPAITATPTATASEGLIRYYLPLMVAP